MCVNNNRIGQLGRAGYPIDDGWDIGTIWTPLLRSMYAYCWGYQLLRSSVRQSGDILIATFFI